MKLPASFFRWPFTSRERETRAGLALGRDDAPLHLDWIVATMAFLAALTLLGGLAAADAASRWRNSLSASITVEIPPVLDNRATTTPEDQLARALTVLRNEPGVLRAEPLPRARLAELLSPWLGKQQLADDLPVPQLIDVTLTPAVDKPALARRLNAAVAGATLDDHGTWVTELLRVAHLVVGLAMGIVGLVALTAVAAVVLATRAGLAVHREAIQVLHLIGAEDRYIARQFAMQAMDLGLRGGLIGLAILAVVLVILGFTSQAVDPKLLPRLWPSIWQLLPLLLVPPASATLAWLTARQTVLRALRRSG